MLNIFNLYLISYKRRFSELKTMQQMDVLPSSHSLLTKLISGRFKNIKKNILKRFYWSKTILNAKEHHSVGALSCKGEQGCGGDHRGPSGGAEAPRLT